MNDRRQREYLLTLKKSTLCQRSVSASNGLQPLVPPTSPVRSHNVISILQYRLNARRRANMGSDLRTLHPSL